MHCSPKEWTQSNKKTNASILRYINLLWRMQHGDLLQNHCGLALLYYWDVLNESLFGRSLHIKQIKWWYLALGILLHLSPKLFCAHLCVPDCIEKIWIDLTLSLFCCCQGIFNHLSSVTNLCIFSYKPHLKKGFPVLQVCVGPFPHHPSPCTNQSLLLCSAAPGVIWAHGGSSGVTDLAFRPFSPLCTHLCCVLHLILPFSRPFQSGRTSKMHLRGSGGFTAQLVNVGNACEKG